MVAKCAVYKDKCVGGGGGGGEGTEFNQAGYCYQLLFPCFCDTSSMCPKYSLLHTFTSNV